MPVKNRFSELLPEITEWRRDIHENPELLFDTPRTSALVEEKLKKFGCDEVVGGIGRTGVVGIIKGQTNKSGKVIGLSKINRIVDYFARRPQVQERLTNQIGNELKEILETDHVAVLIDAKHMCVSSRGVKDDASATVTSFYSGKFKEDSVKKEFLSYL